MSMKSGPERRLAAGAVLFFLILWYAVTRMGLVDPLVVPSPGAVLEAGLEIIRSGYKNNSLLRHIGVSLGRLMSAFLLSALAAIPLGLGSGRSTKLHALLEPVIEFYRPLPPLAYYTVLVLWLGIGDSSKIVLLFLACFAPIYLACVSAAAGVGRDYINSAYTMGANHWKSFLFVVFPSCLPEIFTGLRTSLGVGYTTLVSAEMVAAVSGIGWMVLDASRYMRSDITFFGIIVMGITGILLDRIIKVVEQHLVPWKGKL